VCTLSREAFEEEAKSRYDELLKEFLNLAINRFTWENLPSGLTSEQLENLLIKRGQMMFFKTDKVGELLLPCFPTSDINVYGLATQYRVNGENGKYNETIDIDNGVILKNNPLASADLSTLEIFAKRIDDVEMTQDVNLFQQCMPKLLLADEDSKLTAKTIVDKIRKFKFVVFGKKSLVTNITTSDVLDTSAPYILDKLQQQKIELKNELLTYLGINTVNIMKKERVNTEEVNANNDYTQTNIDLMFDLRTRFCKEVNERFGQNIKVKKREVEQVGTNNTNPGGNGRE
jgi:hypothetical protein